MGFLRTEMNLIVSLPTNSLGTHVQKGMDGNNLLSWVTQTQVKEEKMVFYVDHTLTMLFDNMSVFTLFWLFLEGHVQFSFLGVLVFFHLYMDVLHSG
jgi:hypothetical protein